LSIANWTKEQISFDEENIHITTAFGEEEYYATFKFYEIYGVLASDSTPLFIRSFIKKPKTKYTLQGLMDEADDANLQNMLKNNPQFLKKG
jgi:hypothetical protein